MRAPRTWPDSSFDELDRTDSRPAFEPEGDPRPLAAPAPRRPPRLDSRRPRSLRCPPAGGGPPAPLPPARPVGGSGRGLPRRDGADAKAGEAAAPDRRFSSYNNPFYPRAVDLFAVRREGKLVPLGPALPALAPGETVEVEVVVRTRSLGHLCTQGTADSNETWVTFSAEEGSGVSRSPRIPPSENARRTILRSGTLSSPPTR